MTKKKASKKLAPTEIELDIGQLRIVSYFSANNDVRYYLNGVAISNGYLIATNGHYFGAYKLPKEYEGFKEVIIPNNAVKVFLAKHHQYSRKLRTCLLKDTGERMELSAGEAFEVFKPIDGKYPDATKILNNLDKEEIGLSNFNYFYASLFQKALKNYIEIVPHGLRAARVKCSAEPDFIGALMPIRL